MRLLLTSAGITNVTIAAAVVELVGKPTEEISVLFIPTAANPIADDKSWLIDNLVQLKEQNYKSVDILDIAGSPKEMWLQRMEAVDLICVGGGDEQYLAKTVRDSGLETELPQLLKTRVYMGISAGSMVVGQFLPHELIKIVYPEEVFEQLAPPLGYIDYLFIPHLNSEDFASVKKEKLESLRDKIKHPLYACDDQSALKVVGEKIEIVGEGETILLAPA